MSVPWEGMGHALEDSRDKWAAGERQSERGRQKRQASLAVMLTGQGAADLEPDMGSSTKTPVWGQLKTVQWN